jgi:hypothetical protein
MKCVATNKVNQEETKPVVICNYSFNMSGVYLKDQMLQLYLTEWKCGIKWYLKLFKRTLIVAIHNTMVMNQSFPCNKSIDSLKFMVALAKGPIKYHSPGVPHPVYGHPLTGPLPIQFIE